MGNCPGFLGNYFEPYLTDLPRAEFQKSVTIILNGSADILETKSLGVTYMMHSPSSVSSLEDDPRLLPFPDVRRREDEGTPSFEAVLPFPGAFDGRALTPEAAVPGPPRRLRPRGVFDARPIRTDLRKSRCSGVDFRQTQTFAPG